MRTPKVAIFYDWLNQWGGAEKVLLDILSIYPKSDLFTLVYDPINTKWLPKTHQILTSKLNYLPFSQKNPIIYTPTYDLFLENLNFTSYDILISTTSTVGHSFITSPTTLFICYFFNINRYLYQTPTKYRFLEPVFKIYRKIDSIYAQRPDYIFCDSKTVQKRIKNSYHRNSQIIYPGIDTDFFIPAKVSSKSYFLIVSRLVSYKNIDLAIKLFNNLTHKLLIVGAGREYQHLRNLATNKNIILLGKVNQRYLRQLYQNCIALICPQIEDFGLTPIEAQACGKPVIAYNSGGITETVINGKTGIFFNSLSEMSLKMAINKLFQVKLSSEDCRKNSLRFSRNKFVLDFKQSVDTLWKKHQTPIF